MPHRMLSALRFGLGAHPNTMVNMPGGDGLTPLALAAMCGEKRAKHLTVFHTRNGNLYLQIIAVSWGKVLFKIKATWEEINAYQ